MDLTQNKLSRQEWNNLETSVSDNEKTILNILISGYDNTNISINKNLSLIEVLKIEYSQGIEKYLYNKYFSSLIYDLNKKYDYNQTNDELEPVKLQKIKSCDMVRLQNVDIDKFTPIIFEYTLIDLYKNILKSIKKKKDTYVLYVYTIKQLLKTKIKNINKCVVDVILNLVNHLTDNINVKSLIKNAYTLIEQNPYLLEYQDIELYNHQKQIYEIYKKKLPLTPSLILYTAPTGTGKTLTPIGLSKNYKIIFVCVARHIGLALAKSAISVNKKIAFAFGCTNENDIRLHYYSGKSFMRHTQDTNPKKAGQFIKFKDGSRKIDNSDGSSIEIMICDVKSYLTSMNYMLKFNPNHNIITFWDEPTITLDYQHHELHDIISNNWKQNEIPNLILSCATLPQTNSIQSCIDNFTHKFPEPIICEISSNECKKSIPIINLNQQYICLHNMDQNFNDFNTTLQHVNINQSLLRYLDLHNIIHFIEYFNENLITNEHHLHYSNYFKNDIINITMNSIKQYYLLLLNSISIDNFDQIYSHFHSIQTKPVFNNHSKGIQFTTSDAYTLTDGPTIFLCDDVNKIGSFYIQQSKIPENTFKSMLAKIAINDKLASDIEKVEKLIAAKEEKMGRNDGEEITKIDKEDREWYNNINKLRKQILFITLDAKHVPNTSEHQTIWNDAIEKNRFMPIIDEQNTKEIMSLNMSNHYKVLLLMGIGIFVKDTHVDYTELMKKLALEQKLFIIIASTDYIYGTNYQFCHGIIGKDLENMSQQKIMQSLGRIGRNNIQQTYTVRFRSDNIIHKLFKPDTENIEANNMTRLFS